MTALDISESIGYFSVNLVIYLTDFDVKNKEIFRHIGNDQKDEVVFKLKGIDRYFFPLFTT